jgi:hypothetical protein
VSSRKENVFVWEKQLETLREEPSFSGSKNHDALHNAALYGEVGMK